MTLNWDNPLAASVPRTNGHKPPLKLVDESFVDEPTVEVDESERSAKTQVAVKSPTESATLATAVTEAASDNKPLWKPHAPTSHTFTTEPFKPQQPIRSDDKRVINGSGDINQLAPFKYPWAWEFFLNANKNHWTPLDINMAQDVHDYHHNLSPAERHVYENVLAYLTTSDILAMRNIGLGCHGKNDRTGIANLPSPSSV